MTRLAGERTATRDDALERAAVDVAEGRPVDWAAVGGLVRSPRPSSSWKTCASSTRLPACIGRTISRLFSTDHVLLTPRIHRRPGPGNPGAASVSSRWSGSGSFGGVYRAWDPDLEREIAIKILHRRVADEELRNRLLSEGRALAKLSHDNVVRCWRRVV